MSRRPSFLDKYYILYPNRVKIFQTKTHDGAAMELCGRRELDVCGVRDGITECARELPDSGFHEQVDIHVQDLRLPVGTRTTHHVPVTEKVR
jgi:hypothetical protein